MAWLSPASVRLPRLYRVCRLRASVPRMYPVTRIRLLVRLPCHFDVCILHVDVQHREHVSLGGVCFTRTMYSSVARVRYTHPLHEAVFLCHHHCQIQASLSRDRWRRLLYVSDTTCALQACVTHIRLPFVQHTTDACLPHCRWSKPVALVVWACLIHASVTRAD